MPEEIFPFAVVADDDALARISSADILENAGFHVLEAADVNQALQILESNGQDVTLLLTDVRMPPNDRTGFELARECAASWPHISILVASGVAEPSPGDLPDGAIFIRKPLSSQRIYDRLQELLPLSAQPALLKAAV